jgi:hypothetical protein
MYLLCVHTATLHPVDSGSVQCIYYVYSVATLHPVDSGSVQCIYYMYSVATLHPVDSGGVQCIYCVHTATFTPVDSGGVQCIYYVYTQLPLHQWIQVVYSVFTMCTHSYLYTSGFRWCTVYLLCVQCSYLTYSGFG